MDESKAERQDRMVRSLFGEAGIPDHVKAGWAAIEQLRKSRLEVGYPLPSGGCFLLGRESVVAGCLAEMHAGLAAMLHLEVDRITMRLDRTPKGYIVPVADITLPDDWLLPLAKDPRQSPDEAAKQYLDACVESASAKFRADVIHRLDHCESLRPEVAQKIESFG